MTCCSISFFDTSIGIVQYCSSDDDCDGGVKMMIDGDGDDNNSEIVAILMSLAVSDEIK